MFYLQQAPIPGRQGVPGQTVVVQNGVPGQPGTNLVPFRLMTPATPPVTLDAVSGFSRIASVPFDPTAYYKGATVNRALYFGIAAETTVGVTGRLALYDPISGTYIANSQIDVSSLVPAWMMSAALSIGDSANMIKNTVRVYEVHAKIQLPSSPVTGNILRVFSEGLYFDFTAKLRYEDIMAGTPHGRIDARVNLTTANTAYPGPCMVQEIFKTCFDHFNGSSRHQIIARNNGIATVLLPGATRGTGYWDQATPFGHQAFFVVDHLFASARYQSYWMFLDGSAAGPADLNYDGGTGTSYARIYVAMASTTSSGGAWVSPWAGTTLNNGSDTRAAPVWNIPSGGRGYFFPRANSRGGGYATNRNNLSALTDSIIASSTSQPSRFHLVTDDDNWALLWDYQDDSAYYLNAGGVYVPRSDLAVDRPLLMASQSTTSYSRFRRYYDSTSSAFGPAATGSTNYNGGIRVSDNHVGVGGAGVGIDVHGLIFDDLSAFEGGASAAYQNFQPDKAFSPTRNNEFPHWVGVWEPAGAFGYAGQWDFLRSTRGVNNLDTNTAKTRAYFGNSTANDSRVSIPWDGVSTPGLGTSRAGISF